MSVNHEAKLIEDITNLMTRDSFNDVRIRLSNGVQIDANKVILSARSTFFDKKLQENVKNDQLQEIDLDISGTKEMLELVMKYFYTGKVNFEELSLKDLLDLLHLLEFFDLELFEKVENFTTNKIEEGGFSCEKLLILSCTAETYKFDSIKNEMINYLDNNISDVSKLPEIKYLSYEFLVDLIEEIESQGENHNNEAFLPRFEIVTSWLDANHEVDEELKEKLLSMFDLKRFTNQQLTSSVRNSKLFPESVIFDVLSQSVANLEDKLEKLEEGKKASCKQLKKIEAENESLKKTITKLQTAKSRTSPPYSNYGL